MGGDTILQLVPDGPLLFKGAEALEAAFPQKALPLPDKASGVGGGMGVRSQRDELAAQFPVQPQPLGVWQRRIAPVDVQLDASSVDNPLSPPVPVRHFPA